MNNPQNAAFATQFRYERAAGLSHNNFTIAGGGFGVTTVTIPHNLGYRPYFKLWVKFASNKMYPVFGGPASYNLDGNNFQVENVTSDATNITVVLDNFGVPALSGTLYWRIYEERVA